MMGITKKISIKHYTSKSFVIHILNMCKEYTSLNFAMSSVQVQISDGALEGQLKTSIRDGFQYVSFQGIPYAKPPVGSLRFQPPQPLDPWLRVRSAKTEGPSCYQLAIEGVISEPNISEDCLYLNVYTPKLPDQNSNPKAVLFWVHGGGFQNGSGSSRIYGPDFLITEDVVIVTMNYRLGPFGFLSLGNSLCPGNNGLKDIVMSLKWVQKNIPCFGGEPKNVTVFGESSGGACVELLVLSPTTRGLFHKAIIMSGSSLSPWTIMENPRDIITNTLNILKKDPANDEEIMKVFLKTSAEDLCASSFSVYDKSDFFPKLLFYRAVIEPPSDHAFLTEHPKEIIKRGDIPDIPIMYGVTSLDGLFCLIDGKKPGTIKTNVNYDALTRRLLDLPLSSNVKDVVIQKVRQFIQQDGFDHTKLCDVYSFLYFHKGIAESVKMLRQNPNRKSPTFLYKFSYDGQRNFFKIFSQVVGLKGACHGDDLGYLFQFNAFNNRLSKYSNDFQVIKLFTKTFGDFTKNGDPWPEEKNKILNENYFEITRNLTLREDFLKNEFQFWESIRDLL